jgi:hypothetical protein
VATEPAVVVREQVVHVDLRSVGADAPQTAWGSVVALGREKSPDIREVRHFSVEISAEK